MDSEDLTVGITLRNIDLYAHPSYGQTYYGYICGAGKKLSNSEEATSYGECCVKDDKIGILLEFGHKDAKLTFYRNRVRII